MDLLYPLREFRIASQHSESLSQFRLYGTTLAQFGHYCRDYFAYDTRHVKALVSPSIRMGDPSLIILHWRAKVCLMVLVRSLKGIVHRKARLTLPTRVLDTVMAVSDAGVPIFTQECHLSAH